MALNYIAFSLLILVPILLFIAYKIVKKKVDL